MKFSVPFFDLRAGFEQDQKAMEKAALEVLGSGHWIGGPEVEAFEKAWAQFSGVKFSVGVANGTDAITLALWASGVKAGDEVLLPALSAYPSAVGVIRSGAVPVFVDVNREDGLLNVELAHKAVTPKTRAIMPVHLYGNACDMAGIASLAKKHSLAIVEDCAQAHGVLFEGRHAGSFSSAAAWSFYPTKNLGAAGDAGAVTTDSPQLAEKLKGLRNYGQRDRYVHAEEGVNSRLDPMQAALLSARLPRLKERNERRRNIGALYEAALAGAPSLRCIPTSTGRVSNRHLFPVFAADKAARERLQESLAGKGVQALVHYPVAMPDQPATPPACRAGDFSSARYLADTELSLPIYPEMTDGQVQQVIGALLDS